MPIPHGFTYDANLQYKDAGAVTADGADQVAAANKIVDVGAGRFDGAMIIDVTAIDVSSGDERYVINVQGSNDPTFATGSVNLASMQLGDSTTTLESADSVVGRYELPFDNEVQGTIYRYTRTYHDVAGTTPSINYTAFAVKSFSN